MKVLYSIYIILIVCIFSACSSPKKLVFRDDFSKGKLSQKWDIVNGDWSVNNACLSGSRTSDDWGIILSRKKMPENYLLTFSALSDSAANLFEIIANLKGEKFFGIMQNQLEEAIKLEDRSLFSPENRIKEKTLVCTTGNIGQLPEINYPNSREWLHWKILRTGNHIYIWINDEDVISFTDKIDLLNTKGKFGFIISGKVQIKNIHLYSLKKEEALPPQNFEGRPLVWRMFLFGE